MAIPCDQELYEEQLLKLFRHHLWQWHHRDATKCVSQAVVPPASKHYSSLEKPTYAIEKLQRVTHSWWSFNWQLKWLQWVTPK